MKFRIKESYETVSLKRMDNEGNVTKKKYDSKKKYFPQYRKFLFWHNYQETLTVNRVYVDTYFDTENEAVDFIKKKKINFFFNKNYHEKKNNRIIKM